MISNDLVRYFLFRIDRERDESGRTEIKYFDID